MLALASAVAGFVYHFVIIYTLLTACVHLRDIATHAEELISISYHVSEIRRRLNVMDRRKKPVDP